MNWKKVKTIAVAKNLTSIDVDDLQINTAGYTGDTNIWNGTEAAVYHWIKGILVGIN
jgi:hypothetical protein